MGRPRKNTEAVVDKKAVRERLKDKRLEGWQRQRLKVVQLSMDASRALPEIAAQVGIHPRTVSTRLELLRESGLEGLLNGRKWLETELGRPFKLVTGYKYLGKCEARLNNPAPRARETGPQSN